MEQFVSVIKKLDERSGEKDGRKWKRATYLGELIGGGYSEKKFIAFEVVDGDKNRIASFDAYVGAGVGTLSFTVEARQIVDKAGKERWFTNVFGWMFRK